MATRTNKRLALYVTLVLVALTGAGLGWHLWRTSAPVARAPAHQHLPGVAYAQEEGGKQLYTCGMHPNVIQEGPGTCPICGMDLTPVKKAGAKKKPSKKGKRKIKYWRAPMDPNYIRDKPGKSPMGMDLVPVYEGEEDDSSKGTITVDPVMVQDMGVRVAHVKRGPLARRVRTIGEVVVAEDLVSVVNLKYSGWIERLYVDETGVKVRRGQALFSVYSPELVSAQEEYLLAIRTSGKDSPLARSARARLSFWDLGPATLRRIEQRGKAVRTLTITAPRSGYVLHKDVVQGARVNAGQDCFRIGKLEAIWVQAQVYEWDAPWIRLGQKASMELSFEKGKQYRGKVSYIYPTLNMKTRTLTVRLEFENPQLQLKPGMFTTVWIETRQRTGVLTIPTEAIIHSGERNIVFVARKEIGKYEPRQVVTGLSGEGHLTEIKNGLEEGETVVVSGQFLLDSESQLQEAMQKLLAARLQARGKTAPAAGAGGDAGSAGGAGGKAKGAGGKARPPHDHGGKTVWTCPMHPTIVEDKPGTCPICGMDLVQKKVK
jgi:Cu(I)/Ag(I) efflux system membrane fusion protein/cobalt-zinc-cadmium efflux system membrane fusion protein